MSHAFDAHSFEQLLDDAERLGIGALNHEQRLAALVTAIEEGSTVVSSTGVAAPTAAHSVSAGATSPELDLSKHLLAEVRELCVSAREQRQMVETILARLLGGRSPDDPLRRRRPRVLVVDDLPDNLEMAATVLDAAGFHALTARNGLDGIIVAHYARPAVVLMDVAMPVLDGLQATQLLKASAVTRHLNVIAYTARPDDLDGPFTNLFAAVLLKPATTSAIVALVQRFLGPGPPGSPLRR